MTSLGRDLLLACLCPRMPTPFQSFQAVGSGYIYLYLHLHLYLLYIDIADIDVDVDIDIDDIGIGVDTNDFRTSSFGGLRAPGISQGFFRVPF